METTQRTQALREYYGWKLVDEPGRLQMIRKGDLRVDATYQRNPKKESVINKIASFWSWAACGALIVAERADGELFIVDGQHRWLAAMKLDSVEVLPCMVFYMENVKTEARGFVTANVARASMNALDKFKAQVVAGDTTAIAVKHMVEEVGYRIGHTNDTLRCVGCPGVLCKEYNVSPEICRLAFGMTVQIFDGGSIKDRVFSGLCMLERTLNKKHNMSLRNGTYLRSLIKAGPAVILRKIREAVEFQGGGTTAYAEGIRAVANNNRQKKNRLPAIQ